MGSQSRSRRSSRSRSPPPPALPRDPSDPASKSSNSKLKLLHITKNAGTSLEMLGKELGLKWGRFWKELESYREKLNPPHTGRMLCEWYHVPPCFFVDDPYKGYVPFAVVRCPYERAISEFRCRWKGFNAPVGKNESKASKRKNATSADLNHWLQKKLKTVSSPPYTNGHFIPQHLYIFGEQGDHGHRYVAEDRVFAVQLFERDIFLRLFGFFTFSPDATSATGTSQKYSNA